MPEQENQIRDLAIDAYIYGHPLVLMDVTREVITATPNADDDRLMAPLNQFAHARQFPDHTFTNVVSPNADTLYSVAWLDLSKEPMILSVPEMGNRYYLMQLLDAWTNVFASPGTRTTGSHKGDFAIVGPRWAGKLPAGLREIKSPTDMVLVGGRTQTNGKQDYAAVHAMQQKYKLTPLNAWGKTYVAPTNVPVKQGVDAKTPPVDQIRRMDARNFFSRLAGLLKGNPPAPADAPFVERFRAFGLEPGQIFEQRNLDPAVVEQLEVSVRDAQNKIAAEAKKPHGKNLNGWEFMENVGRYGTDYLWRAVIALVGLGANLAEDAVYPRATVDSDGQPLIGANQYVLRFAPGELPPVAAFWSVTLYNDKQFFVENPINRYAIGDRDKLKLDNDGALSLYIQNQSPGRDKESNWLPAPSGSFNLFMRLYWPKKEVIEGIWRPPRIERQAAAARKVA
ncbi:MAG: DUF1254 domain-containing protein [Acidobacteriales bacterium]|nr:DUF1254 domain-containing protein [Terriglobales bacterium]